MERKIGLYVPDDEFGSRVLDAAKVVLDFYGPSDPLFDAEI